MALTIGEGKITLKCDRCSNDISVKIPKGGDVSRTSRKLMLLAGTRGWDVENDLCPKHK